jgi:hypothetical protein
MPAIKKPSEHFDATTYTGTGSALSVTNGGFQPDFVWIKSRSTTANYALMDSIRGVANQLQSSTTNAESTNSAGKGLQSFNSGGLTLGQESDAVGGTNANGATYVGWQWKAGGAAVTNTAGSITSQVSANPTAGFSVVTYTGTGSNATVGHGLGVAPSMIIAKVRNASGESWGVYHISLGAANAVYLNLTQSSESAATQWNSTAPNSSVFSIGTAARVNGNTNTFVAYCFAPVAGYSAFGSYTGNGSANGPFVYTGFRPKFFMWKRSNTSGNSWLIVDTSRSPTNTAGLYLQPDNTGAEGGGATMDLLSNGMKIQGDTTASTNCNGYTYIYMAFADSPFKYYNERLYK